MTPAEAYQQSYLNVLSHFVHCLRTGQPAENEARDNLKTLSIVFAAYESAIRQATVAP
jgi:predicted dehydrogenase